jgi:hypothetical protein
VHALFRTVAIPGLPRRAGFSCHGRRRFFWSDDRSMAVRRCSCLSELHGISLPSAGSEPYSFYGSLYECSPNYCFPVDYQGVYTYPAPHITSLSPNYALVGNTVAIVPGGAGLGASDEGNTQPLLIPKILYSRSQRGMTEGSYQVSVTPDGTPGLYRDRWNEFRQLPR